MSISSLHSNICNTKTTDASLTSELMYLGKTKLIAKKKINTQILVEDYCNRVLRNVGKVENIETAAAIMCMYILYLNKELDTNQWRVIPVDDVLSNGEPIQIVKEMNGYAIIIYSSFLNEFKRNTWDIKLNYNSRLALPSTTPNLSYESKNAIITLFVLCDHAVTHYLMGDYTSHEFDKTNFLTLHSIVRIKGNNKKMENTFQPFTVNSIFL